MFYLAVNRDWGGFRVPAEVAITIGCDIYDDDNEIRRDPVLIDWIRKHSYEDLKLACIPDEATDFMINDYDGFETVIMCVNGKLEYAEIWGEE